MKITRLQVQNFKSFDSVDVGLGDLNVFIGANPSGKSNFLGILTFLSDLARNGLEDAVSIHSGEIELLRNVETLKYIDVEGANTRTDFSSTFA